MHFIWLCDMQNNGDKLTMMYGFSRAIKNHVFMIGYSMQWAFSSVSHNVVSKVHSIKSAQKKAKCHRPLKGILPVICNVTLLFVWTYNIAA